MIFFITNMEIILKIEDSELEFQLHERITSCFREEITERKFNKIFKEHKDKIIQELNHRLDNELDYMELFGDIIDYYLLDKNLVRQ